MRFNIDYAKYLINLQEEISEMKKQLDAKFHKVAVLKAECRHDVVFKIWNDSVKNKVSEIIYCPACGLVHYVDSNFSIEDTPFNKTKVVSLTKINVS